MTTKSIFRFLLILTLSIITKQNILDNIKIYGPGLQPDKIVLPARYIILGLNGLQDNKTQVDFNVQGLIGDQSRSCRVWSQKLNRTNQSFILRYKLYETCVHLEISIKYNGKHVAKSPYRFGPIPILHEKCYCPQTNIDQWLDRAKCKRTYNQVNSDLSLFNKGIDWDVIRTKVIDRFNLPNSISICHYVVVSNKIHRKCYGKHVGFNKFMDEILLSMARKMQLPNLEFFVNLGDWPLVTKDPIVPVFSWCGSNDSYDIVLPTYDITLSTLENMGSVMLDMLSVQGNVDFKWDERIEKAFWRGRDSSLERLKLIDLGRENPDLFNVSLTNFFFYREHIEKYGPKTDHVSFYKFFDYKYQICLDGTVAAYRLPYLLAGGSLVFKQNSKYYEHFYNDMIPQQHYIPVNRDLSNLVDQIKWAKDHDTVAREIAENSNKFVNDNLLPLDIYCYHAVLLNDYSKLLKSIPKVITDMDSVEQPDESYNCSCLNLKYKDEL